MRGRTAALVLGPALFLAAPAARSAEPGPAFSPAELKAVLKLSPLPPPPPDETNAVADDPRAARLGQALFYDVRLSGNGRLSCASCHVPHHGFADGLPLAQGMGRGARHTLSLWNVAYNRWFFWDGRADSLWSQALKPLESPREMGGDRLAAVRLVASDPALLGAYRSVFGELPSSLDAAPDASALARAFANLGKAIAAFVRRLVGRRAPFDVFVEGLRDGDASQRATLSVPAQRGLQLFVGRGRCRVCHAGPHFSDGEFHDIGVPPGREVGTLDPGRYEGILALLRDEFAAGGAYSDERDGPRARRTRFVAPRPEARGQVKTPSLRNVASTAPYMHQGQLATLGDVLDYYSTLEGRRGLPADQERILVPLKLSPGEKADLIAFLESLTDDRLDPSLARAPSLP